MPAAMSLALVAQIEYSTRLPKLHGELRGWNRWHVLLYSHGAMNDEGGLNTVSAGKKKQTPICKFICSIFWALSVKRMR
jgi:hypothetical protein